MISTVLKFLFSLSFLFFFTQISYSQNYEFKGEILSETKKPIQGVYILIKDFNKKIISNEKGEFFVQNININQVEIEIRLLGYKTINQIINLNENKKHTFILEESYYRLKGVEITANKNKMLQKESPNISKSFTPKEIQYKAGGGEDVFRTLLSVPGISSQNDLSVQLVIRGSNPEHNLLLMDGIEILNPYRFYGTVSMFNPELVNDINLIAGAFPSKYSDRLSSVIDVTCKDGFDNEVNKPKILTNFNLSNLNVVAEVKLQIQDDYDSLSTENPEAKFGAFVVGFRRTYYDFLIRPFVNKLNLIDGDFILPNFMDFQFKFAFQLSHSDKIIFNAILNTDEIDIKNFKSFGTVERMNLKDFTHNELGSITWISDFGNGLIGQNSVSHYEYGGQNSGQINQNAATSIGLNIKMEEYQKIIDSLKNLGIDIIPLIQSSAHLIFNFKRTTIKSDYLYEYNKNHLFEFGAQFDYLNTDIGIEYLLDARKFLNRQSNYQFTYIPPEFSSKVKTFRLGGFLQDKISVSNKFKILPGIRYDYYEILNKGYFSPGFSLSYLLTDFLNIKAGTGLYHQSPGYEKLFNVNPEIYLKTNLIDLTGDNAKNLIAEKSVHFNTSFDWYITNDITLTFEYYLKKYSDLIVPKIVRGTSLVATLLNPSAPGDPNSWSLPFSVEDDSLTSVPENGGSGKSDGIEVTLRKDISPESPELYGWISYAYASAKRIWKNIEYPFNYERKHNFNITFGYKFGDWLDLNLSFQYAIGFPVTAPLNYKPRIYLFKDSLTNQVIPKLDYDVNGMVFEPDFGKIDNINKSNLPDYHRLDFRVTFFPKWFGWDWRFYVDIINVYNNKNIINRVFYIDRKTQKIVNIDTSILPILPSIGFSILF